MSAAKSPGKLRFSPATSGGQQASLRAYLLECFDNRASQDVEIVTFFELVERLVGHAGGSAEPGSASNFLIFDVLRLVLFRDSGLADRPGLYSLVGFLLDSYPLQPFSEFAAEEGRVPYRFCFEFGALDLVPHCLRHLTPGAYSVMDLVTGEVTTGTLLTHPVCRRPRIVAAGYPTMGSPIRPNTTDGSMRSGPPPDLASLVGEAAGVIRSDDLDADVASLAYARTLVCWNRGSRQEFCFGKALNPGDARSIARCEAIERFQTAFCPPGTELVHGSYAGLSEHAVDPVKLFFGRSPECPRDICPEFDPQIPISWNWAWGPLEKTWRLVPSQEVWFNIPELMNEPRFVMATTSGCAVGSTLEEAALFATMEAIERDAFLTSWYLCRPATEIDVSSFKLDQLRMLVGRFRLAFPDYKAVLYDVTSDIGIPTVAGLAIRERGQGPKVFASVATDIDGEKACFRALKDLTGFSPQISGQRVEKTGARLPASIASPQDHFELYAQDESFAALDYLELGRRARIGVDEIGADSPIPNDERLRLDHVIEALDRRLRSRGAALYIADLTHPDLASHGLRAARAITPGLFPLWFGDRTRRFSVTERLRTLADAYAGRPFDRNRLNLEPHPLS